jgi:hypothetical protein
MKHALGYALGGVTGIALIVLFVLLALRFLFGVRSWITSGSGILSLFAIGAVLFFSSFSKKLAEINGDQRSKNSPTKAASPTPETIKTEPYRKFRNTKDMEIEAKLVYFDGMNVTIQRTDGSKFTNSILIYSGPDQEYIRNSKK